ncbi:MAG: acetoacetate decarboxylase family protein [Burkholderiaceae bacterium]|nr:acetoacetate decarboxylase family protein [Burkholderiaceae bacterium]
MTMFRPEKDHTYLMPAHFGGNLFDTSYKASQRATMLSVSFETDRAELERYIPEELELRIPEVQVALNQLTEINWLGGGHYNLVMVSVPIRFNGKRDHVDAAYPLVVWENRTAPILTGREQTGVPKIFADIEDLHVYRPHYASSISYEGNTFLSMTFEEKSPVTGNDLERMKDQIRSLDLIGWRYIPKVGAPGADLSQFIYFPQWMELEKVHTGTGILHWTELSVMQNPRQHHIIKALSALPVKKKGQSILAEGQVILDTTQARVLT